MKKLALLSLALIAACQATTAPEPFRGLEGQYAAVAVNGAALPANLETSDTLTVRVSNWIVLLRADGTYFSQLYFHEIRPTVTKGIPLVSEGRFSVSGDQLHFTATTGKAPTGGSVEGGKLFISFGVIAGRDLDRYAFEERLILPAGSQ